VKYNGLDFDPSKMKESVTVKPQILTNSKKAFKENTLASGQRYLLPRIEAIHAGATRNHTRYPADKLRGSQELKSGVYSWLYPFAKPVIYNHDIESDPTGRIQAATFSEYTQAGRPGIIVVPKITEAKAISGILGGRLLTVSIGATTDAAVCSICGTDIIAEGFCGHMKGEEYDGIVAEWIVGNVWFDELSWVNVPADQDAKIVDEGQQIHTAETFGVNGQEIVNLGKKTTEWLVNPKTALAEGLVTKEQEGDITLTEEEIQALKLELEEAKQAKEAADAALVIAKEEKEAVVTELATTKETLVSKETELEERVTELTSTKEELATKVGEVEQLTSTNESLEVTKTDLETSLEEEKTAREEALTQNVEFSTQLHQVTAERVVDLRVATGKETNREEALARYASRSAESLSDTLTDLLKEDLAAAKPGRVIEKIVNPVGAIDPIVTESHKDLSTQDVLVSLFKGKK
jgi:hypothetical protein